MAVYGGIKDAHSLIIRCFKGVEIALPAQSSLAAKVPDEGCFQLADRVVEGLDQRSMLGGLSTSIIALPALSSFLTLQ